jgi:hypothetical protein
MRLRHAVCALPFVIACGTDWRPPGSTSTVDTLPDLTVPPAPDPAKGFQIITPIFDNVEPSMDYEVCTWTDVIADHDLDVRSTLSYQNEPPGHHVILFYTTVKQTPGTQRVCHDSDMATFRFLAGAGGEGLPNMAPGNLIYRVPAGAQIVVNHHYLNSTDAVLRGQSAVNVYYAEPGNWVPSGNLAAVDTNISLPQGPSSWDIHCVLQNTMKLWYLIPHMHQWGTHIAVNVTQTGTKNTMFDLPWDPSYAFHPPELRLDPATPMVVNPGDAIDVHCDWNNTSGRTLSFGFEMCVSFGETVDDTGLGNIACDAGSWGQF